MKKGLTLEGSPVPLVGAAIQKLRTRTLAVARTHTLDTEYGSPRPARHAHQPFVLKYLDGWLFGKQGIKKRFRKENKQPASRINVHAPTVPAIAPTYAFGHAYPNVPAFPSALALNASCSWADVQGETMVCRDQLSGYIFMCNGKTKGDCYRYRVFGLPAARMEVVEKIKPQMKLFLFDFDLKLLHGIYIAASNGELAIEPNAFGGKFSAQASLLYSHHHFILLTLVVFPEGESIRRVGKIFVEVRFEIFKDCLPLPESAFKQVVKDNYQGRSKFKQELSDEQVMNLISLFRPIAIAPPQAVASLMSSAVPAQEIEPPGFEKQFGPPAELSASYDQYLAGRHFIQAGPKHHSQNFQQTGTPFSHVPHASVAKVQTIHLSRVNAQPRAEPYYLTEAYQVYCHQNPALPPQDAYNRHAVVPRDIEVLATANIPAQPYTIVPSQLSVNVHGHPRLPSSTRTAAYWAAVASEAAKEVYPTACQSLPSGSTGLGVPVTFEGAASTQLTVAENIDRELLLELGAANNNKWNPPAAAPNALVQALATAPSQYQAPPFDGPVHLPSSSLTAGYWTSAAFVDPNQVYSGPYQWQPLASTGLGAENVPISATEAGSAENPHTGPVYDYYNYNTVLATAPSADTNQLSSSQHQIL
ncbi:hypothetical protein Acr_25g0006800 [Actinidia rufa]|uniref:DCD domain-containing protein n=1 Tax=Actinidia rufa TaxID=165716 RepID=A0A7J0GZR6_9ERIC|nr:hypothetical protein Acr_25g0006800 [Actinidia rufa]